MIKDITLGQYFPGESLLHRSDPRVKILLTFLFMAVVLLVESFWGFLMFVMFLAIVVLFSGVSPKYIIKGLKPVLLIIVFTAVINIFTTKGTPIGDYVIIRNMTYEGMESAAKMALRLILLITGASMLTLTTTPISLTDGIEKLTSPLKVLGFPAHEMAMMMTIALRFIPTLLEETDKIMKAQASRGADFDTGNLIDRAKSFVPVLVPLFISAFRRADELAIAMESRCYRGSEGRTRMKQLKLTAVDFKVSVIMVLFTSAVLFIQYF